MDGDGSCLSKAGGSLGGGRGRQRKRGRGDSKISGGLGDARKVRRTGTNGTVARCGLLVYQVGAMSENYDGMQAVHPGCCDTWLFYLSSGIYGGGGGGGE